MRDYGYLEARDSFLNEYERVNKELFDVVETLIKANNECIYSLTGSDISMRNVTAVIGKYKFKGINATQLAKYIELHPYLTSYVKDIGKFAIVYNCEL